MLSVVMLSVAFYYFCAKCHYAQCRGADSMPAFESMA
jgi:hypothetical protein